MTENVLTNLLNGVSKKCQKRKRNAKKVQYQNYAICIFAVNFTSKIQYLVYIKIFT